MTHTLVVWVCLKVAPVLNVIKVLNIVLLCHLAQDVNISVGSGVCCKDVMIRDQHHPLVIPDLPTAAQGKGDQCSSLPAYTNLL